MNSGYFKEAGVRVALMRTAFAIWLSIALIALNLDGFSLAATPTSGTLTTTSPTTTYSAGPFVVPNPTAQSGSVICNAATPCDEFNLAVTVPAGYNTAHNISVKIEWPNTAADFDLYVLDSAGNEVKSSASSSDPEIAVFPALSGNYTVRVVPFAPLGDSFKGTLSLVDKPAAPPTPPASGPAPQYNNYAAPNGLGTDAGEPSIGVNWKTGSVMFQANTQTLRVAFDDTKSPATATWQDHSAPTSVTSLDPIMFTDNHTGRTMVSQLLAAGSLASYTDDDGTTWTPSQGSGIGSGVDHQTLGGGPFAPGVLGPLTSYPNAFYYCVQGLALATCALSQDGGLTFGPAVPMYNLTQCGGLHGHVKVAPDGTVYVPNKGCGSQQAVVVSSDNGLSWSVRPVPGSLAGDSDPSVAIGADGTLYFGYQNGDGHPRVAVSHDKGLNWSSDLDVGSTFGIQNTAFPAMVAGDGDRAALAFLGTPTAGNYQDQATFQGIWHLYVAHTYDGGKSWVTTDATPNDPVQRGSIWLGGGSHQDRNLLDFMGADVDKQGRVLVGYADGCIGSCVSSGPNSFSALATISRQSSGRGLFAAYDQPDLTVTSIVAYYNKGGNNVLTATVSNIGYGKAQNVVVRFLDGSTVVGNSAPVTLTSGQSALIAVPWNTGGKRSNHVITAIVDPLNSIAESNETNNQLQKTIASR